MKRTSITFEHRPNSTEASKNTPYRCLKTVNTLVVTAGEWYSKNTVEGACRALGCEVTIVAED